MDASFLRNLRTFNAQFVAWKLHSYIDMILLVTPSARGHECAAAIEASITEPAQLAQTLQDAVSRLRGEEFSAVVLDQALLETDPDQADLVEQHVGTATPVYVNCAISGISRVVRELRAALHRRNKESAIARKAAGEALRCELRESLTAILLDCELALALPSLQPLAREKFRAVRNLAAQMAETLAIDAPMTARK
jgi:hypothetical protein